MSRFAVPYLLSSASRSLSEPSSSGLRPPGLSVATVLSPVVLPVELALATVLAGAHAALARAGLDPAGGLTWTLAIALVVLVVRVALLPAVAHTVRSARAAALARPKLAALRATYAGRRDADSLRALAAERRAIQAEHGLSPWGCLPALAQLPVVFALYSLLTDVSAGRGLGAMDAALVASAGSASILGVRLADRLATVGADPRHLAVVALFAAASAALSYATQRWFVLPNTASVGELMGDVAEPLAAAQRLMPMLSAAGVLVAATAVPLGLLVYWLANSAWTLAQQAVIARRWPTPGSPAADRRAVR